jgi:hypothetical protein
VQSEEKECESIYAELLYVTTKQINSRKDPQIVTTIGDNWATIQRSEHGLGGWRTIQRMVQCNMGSSRLPYKRKHLLRCVENVKGKKMGKICIKEVL